MRQPAEAAQNRAYHHQPVISGPPATGSMEHRTGCNRLDAPSIRLAPAAHPRCRTCRSCSPDAQTRRGSTAKAGSPEELRGRIPVIIEMDLLLNVTYQSLMTLLVAAGRLADHAPEFIPRITAYVEDARRRDIRVTECITDAKGDRSLAPSKQSDPDAYVRVVGRRPDGVVIRGAKLHITAAAFGHDLLVMPTKSMKPGEEDYAIACAVPVGSPGVHVTNTTYHPRGGDPRDYPVSARASVPDSVVIFDDVFVPNERVFLDGQAAHAAVFAHSLGLWERLGGVSFMVNQADELVGLASLIAEANGLARV
jgi:4-hydroxybutyryl-CoA dehydratase / vinylacetyl-CoA-Delta-isomerase